MINFYDDNVQLDVGLRYYSLSNKGQNRVNVAYKAAIRPKAYL